MAEDPTSHDEQLARREHTEHLRRVSGGLYKVMLLGVILLTLWRDALDSGVESLLALLVPVLLALAVVVDVGRAARAVLIRLREAS